MPAAKIIKTESSLEQEQGNQKNMSRGRHWTQKSAPHWFVTSYCSFTKSSQNQDGGQL